jgi:alanyl-tRNA synthetase
MSEDEITQVENFVNSKIEARLKLEENRSIPIKDALSQGALALFGEKYGDVVRTIKFGNSIELCGGTHVNNTSDIWNFKIKSEGAIAAGIRRIEAITSDAVKDYYAENNNQFNHIKSLLNNTSNPVKSVTELKEENINLKKEIELLLNEKANVLRLESIQEIKKINGVNFLSKKVDLDANLLKSISFKIGQDYDDLLLVFGSNFKNKALISCYISKPLIKNRGLNASNIVRELGKHIQGGGGGQDFFATAGGKNPDGIFEALKKVKIIIESS